MYSAEKVERAVKDSMNTSSIILDLVVWFSRALVISTMPRLGVPQTVGIGIVDQFANV